MKNTNAKGAKKNGYTFIELLLYVAIVGIVVTALTTFALAMVGLNAKNTTQQEVNNAARFLAEKIKYEIRNSNGINSGTSNFGVDLATNASYQLSLIDDAPNNPTIFNVTNGKLGIKQGAAAVVELNSSDTDVTSLIFTNYTSGDNKTENIGFVLTVTGSYSSTAHSYTDTVTIDSAAEVRSN